MSAASRQICRKSTGVCASTITKRDRGMRPEPASCKARFFQSAVASLPSLHSTSLPSPCTLLHHANNLHAHRHLSRRSLLCPKSQPRHAPTNFLASPPAVSGPSQTRSFNQPAQSRLPATPHNVFLAFSRRDDPAVPTASTSINEKYVMQSSGPRATSVVVPSNTQNPQPAPPIPRSAKKKRKNVFLAFPPPPSVRARDT